MRNSKTQKRIGGRSRELSKILKNFLAAAVVLLWLQCGALINASQAQTPLASGWLPAQNPAVSNAIFVYLPGKTPHQDRHSSFFVEVPNGHTVVDVVFGADQLVLLIRSPNLTTSPRRKVDRLRFLPYDELYAANYGRLLWLPNSARHIPDVAITETTNWGFIGPELLWVGDHVYDLTQPATFSTGAPPSNARRIQRVFSPLSTTAMNLEAWTTSHEPASNNNIVRTFIGGPNGSGMKDNLFAAHFDRATGNFVLDHTAVAIDPNDSGKLILAGAPSVAPILVPVKMVGRELVVTSIVSAVATAPMGPNGEFTGFLTVVATIARGAPGAFLLVYVDGPSQRIVPANTRIPNGYSVRLLGLVPPTTPDGAPHAIFSIQTSDPSTPTPPTFLAVAPPSDTDTKLTTRPYPLDLPAGAGHNDRWQFPRWAAPASSAAAIDPITRLHQTITYWYESSGSGWTLDANGRLEPHHLLMLAVHSGLANELQHTDDLAAFNVALAKNGATAFMLAVSNRGLNVQFQNGSADRRLGLEWRVLAKAVFAARAAAEKRQQTCNDILKN